MKEWKKPEIQNLTLQATKEEGVESYFYWPWSPACDDAANNTGKVCPKVHKPCKYYCDKKCTAPVTAS